MGTYILHAWRDAMSIVVLMDELYGIAKARAIFEGIDQQVLVRYESDASREISDFIAMTETQRRSFMKKFKQNDNTRVGLMTLAVIGCLRAKAILELRDNYRYALAPGAGNRETTSAVYRFGSELVTELLFYEWPDEVVGAMGMDSGDDNEF